MSYSRYNPAAKVIVHNYPPKMHEERLTNMFKKFGKIVYFHMPYFGVPEKALRFGFVQYQREEDAHNAIKSINGWEIGGMKLSVEIAQRRCRTRSPSPNRVLLPPRKQKILKCWDRMSRDQQDLQFYPAAKVIIHNYPPWMSWQRLRDIFNKFGKNNYISLPYFGVPEKDRGFGFIQYQREDDAHDAINSINRWEIRGMKLSIEIAQRRTRSPSPIIRVLLPPRKQEINSLETPEEKFATAEEGIERMQAQGEDEQGQAGPEDDER